MGSLTNVIKDRRDDIKRTLYTATPLILLIVITVFFQIVSQGRLFTARNIPALFNSMFPIVLGGLGVTFLIAQGNLDFSMGPVSGVSAALAGFAAWLNPGLSFVVALCVGLIAGLFNGVIHTYFRVSAIVTTLSTAFIFRGIQATLIATGSISLPASMFGLENRFLKVSIVVAALVACGVFYNKTRLGKFSRAIGSRVEAAYLSGIRISRMKLFAFAVAGTMAGFVGFFNYIKSASVSANTGTGFEFDVLLAMLLGGMPISGGSSARFRCVLIGSLIITILQNGMLLWGLDSVTQQLIRGIIFLFAVSLSFDRRNMSVID